MKIDYETLIEINIERMQKYILECLTACRQIFIEVLAGGRSISNYMMLKKLLLGDLAMM